MGKEKNKEAKARCLEFLKRSSSMDEARETAKKEGFEAPMSVWLGAFRWKLDGKGEPKEEESAEKAG